MKKIDFETKVIIILVICGVTLFIFNFMTLVSTLISLISIGIVITGPAVFEYKRYRENKEIEEKFPDFLRDITQNIKTGMTLTQSIKATKETYYGGSLTPHVKKMITKIDWAIPFDQVLIDFSKKSTPLIQKIVSTILETYRGGGDITQVLIAASQTIKEINKIRKERFSAIYNQMVTGYAIFFIFVGVLIILKNYLVPSLLSFGAEFAMGVGDITEFYNTIFQWLVLIEGFFSGLVVGKMAQGSIIAGLKHSLFLMAVGYGAFYLFL